ncbi:MAG: SGNH/GDSL hydrolase family protein [Phycisphaerales bacterium]|nr:MAG: SGNH/GDSL hydrolase family protein [Phycisphaerales bacterium]
MPDRADVVVFGDSQTYGMGIDLELLWPQQFARASGRDVYAMSFPGWGPVHYLILWDRAARLRPRVIVEAFYSGNDLYDAFHSVYDIGQFPDLKTRDHEQARMLAEAEQIEPYSHVVGRHFRLALGPREPKSETRGPLGELARTCASHIRLFGAVYKACAIVPSMLQPREKPDWGTICADAQARGDDLWPFEHDGTRTVLTPAYRMAALNLSDPRIREGHQVSLRTFSRKQDRASRAGAEFVVLLIPTKELAFKDAVERGLSGIPSTYVELIRFEERMWEDTKGYLDQQGIVYVDALPALRACVSGDSPAYPMSTDGHPTAAGHRAIAESLSRELSRLGLLPAP